MIEILDLRFCYAGSPFQLEIPELRVDAGAALALVGPSGSGKTTLLNLVAGILTPSEGRITTGGLEVSSASEASRRDFRLRKIGLVFQEFELLEHLSVADNILLPCRLSDALTADAATRARLRQLADEVGIGDKLKRYPRRLSQGERQRVAVCRALLLEPELLLCDEPTGNLDPGNKAVVLDALFGYAERRGATMVTVTHDHQLLERFSRTIDIAEFQPLSRSHV